MATHSVTNQAPAREDLDEYSLDLPLVEGVRRHGAAWAVRDGMIVDLRCLRDLIPGRYGRTGW